jgi:hypothetical protein
VHVLADELRSPPIEVEIDAVLVLQVRVDRAVGQSADDREFVAGLRIEIGVARADVDRRKAEAQIGQPVRIVGAAISL